MAGLTFWHASRSFASSGLFRIYKAYRLVKKYGVQYITTFLSTNRAAAALYILVLMVILIIETGSYLVLVGGKSFTFCKYPDRW